MKIASLKAWQIYGVGGAASAALTLGAWFLLAAPAIERHQQDRALQMEALDRHRQLPALSAELTTTRRKSTAVHQTLELTRLTLQPTSALNERIAQLATLAVTCGVTVDEVRPGLPEDAAHYQALPIHLSASGSYLECADFLRRLHETLPDIAVKSMEAMNASSGAGGTFHLELIWYAKK